MGFGPLFQAVFCLPNILFTAVLRVGSFLFSFRGQFTTACAFDTVYQIVAIAAYIVAAPGVEVGGWWMATKGTQSV